MLFDPLFWTRAALIFICLVWLKRSLWVSRFNVTHPPLEPAREAPSQGEKVSVIIPARNEEKNIANCLVHLFKQNYPSYEIIVVDDRSTDKTSHLLENFQKLSTVPLRIVRIEKLPPGWTGKNHGMFAASKVAEGEWLLYTDADTTHRPESISTAMREVKKNNIDFLTLAPETESHSFWEKTVQPLAVGSLALWFHPAQAKGHHNEIVLANGQFILIRKDAYEKIGGNESIKNEVVEDVELAKKAKKAGYRVEFWNGTKLYSTRMYSSLREIRMGWTRIFTYLFNKNVPSIAHKIFLFLFFSLFPFVALAWELVLRTQNPAAVPAELFYLTLITCGWIILVRFIGNKMVKSNPWYAFLHPVGSVIMVWILLACVGRILFNRPSVWRGDLHQ